MATSWAEKVTSASLSGRKRRTSTSYSPLIAGPSPSKGSGIARGRIEDKGQPGTVFKYYRGQWDRPGLTGKSTPLFPAITGWKGPYVKAFWGPSVHWNSFLKAYVALLNQAHGENWTQGGIYISFSKDLLNWTTPERILTSNDWYPQVLGLGPTGTDSVADKYLRLYVGGVSTTVLEFLTPG